MASLGLLDLHQLQQVDSRKTAMVMMASTAEMAKLSRRHPRRSDQDALQTAILPLTTTRLQPQRQ